jgi:undecaprenyl-diphosphatase
VVSGLRRPVRYRLLPATSRRSVLTVVAAAALVAVALGLRYADEAYPRWLDRVASTLVDDWFPIPRGAARLVIGLFDPVPLAVLVAVLAGVCLALRRRRLAVLAVAGPVLTGAVTTVLKPVVDRTKEGDLAYPSGHTGAAVSLALVVAMLVVSLVRARRAVRVAVLAAVPTAVGAGVGLAMTATDYHYLTDAIGGFCVAVAVVLSLAVLLDRRPSRHVAQVAAADTARNVPGSSRD